MITASRERVKTVFVPGILAPKGRAGSFEAPPAMSSVVDTSPPALGWPARVGLRRWLMGAAVVAAGLALVWAVGELRAYESRPVTLAGVRLPAGDPETFVRRLAAQWHETELSLDAGSQVVRATRRELGGAVDADDALAALREARGDAPLHARVFNAWTDESRALDWDREVNEEITHAFLADLRRRASVDPEPTDVDGRGGRPGVSLNLTPATAAVAEALETDRVFLRLPVRPIAPAAYPVRDAHEARFTEVVAAHETRYAFYGEAAGRARNIELATRFLDGAVIEPGGELSFNEVVGERTFERGFAPAIELARGGRRTEGIGGGVCQAAATLHAAAFFAGFDITEHHPHTRNSSYIPAGLDAAVSWPNKDVRIQNPYPFHVRVRASAYRGTMRVELMGARRAPRVEWNTRVLHRAHAVVEREVDPRLPSGAEEVVDEGEDGSVLERTRTVFWSRGAATQSDRLRYPMVTRLVRVGPGAAASAPEAAP